MTQKQVAKRVQSILDSIEELKHEIGDIRDESQCYFDERSEKWQDGEKGQLYQEMIDALESAIDETDSVIDTLMCLIAE